MAYDAKKEKVIKTEEVQLKSDKMIAIGKIYSYNGGPKKFKLLFKGKNRNGDDFYSSGFYALTDIGDVKRIAALLKKFEKEALGKEDE